MLELSGAQDVDGCSRRLEVLIGEKGVVGGGEVEEERWGSDDQSQACNLPIHHCPTLKMFRLHLFHSHLNCCCWHRHHQTPAFPGQLFLLCLSNISPQGVL